VADQKQGEAAPLGEADQFLRRGADLRHGTGGGFKVVQEHGLDGIDDHDVDVFGGVQRGYDVSDVGGGGERHGRFVEAQTARPQAELRDRFLAGDVERLAAAGEAGGDLHQQGRLADPGIAADQHGGAGYEPAAQYAVELGNAGDTARRILFMAVEADEFDFLAALGTQALGCAFVAGFLGQAVPRAAGIATAHPFRMCGAAFLADIDGFCFGQATLPQPLEIEA
jgi:hypothetical protein